MKEFFNWCYPQSYFTRIVSMQNFSKILTHRCAILPVPFSSCRWIKPQKANSLHTGTNYIPVRRQLFAFLGLIQRQLANGTAKYHMCVFFVLTVLFSFTVHTLRNYVD